MKISTMKELLGANVVCCEENIGKHVYSACGSDMMSDVLAYVKDQAVLVTGLNNPQVIRTADMMDMVCVVYVRGKRPDALSLELAVDSNICVMTTKTPMFACCGILYENGLRGA